MTSRETFVEIATRAYGKDIALDMYDYFDMLNNRLYDGKLPYTLITFEILAYGRCIGLTNTSNGHIRIKKPPKGTPINFDGPTLGILLHEMIHYANNYVAINHDVHVSASMQSSHMNPYWIGEINRIHKIITGDDLNAGPEKMKRVGKKVKRVMTGSLTRDQISRYPMSLDPDLVLDYLYYGT